MLPNTCIFILPSIFLVSIQFFVSFFHHEECLNYKWIFFCCSVYKICTLDLFLYIVCRLYKNVVHVLLCTALCKVWELVYFVGDVRIWNSQNFSEYFFSFCIISTVSEQSTCLLHSWVHWRAEYWSTLSMCPETETWQIIFCTATDDQVRESPEGSVVHGCLDCMKRLTVLNLQRNFIKSIN